MNWDLLVDLLVELANTEFCVFDESDEAAEIVDRLIAIVANEVVLQ